MGERTGLHCEKHGKWCPSGACDDCAAMAAERPPAGHDISKAMRDHLSSMVAKTAALKDPSKTIVDNVGPGAAMCEQEPETIFDLVDRQAMPFDGLKKLIRGEPFLQDGPYIGADGVARRIGIDPGRDEGTVKGPLTAEEIRRNKDEWVWQASIDLGSVPDKTVMSLHWAAWRRGLLYDSIRQWKPNLVQVLNSIPASVQALRRTDDLIGHFCNRLVAGGRYWSAEVAAELVVEMAARDAERVEQHLRLFKLLGLGSIQIVVRKSDAEGLEVTTHVSPVPHEALAEKPTPGQTVLGCWDWATAHRLGGRWLLANHSAARWSRCCSRWAAKRR